MLVIIDSGIANLRSIQYKLQRSHINAMIASEPEEIEKATMLIFPGVGHFAKGMENLRSRNLISILNQKVLDEKTPILGICLGMQLFTKRSEEGNVEGLGWIDAETKRFRFNGENGNLRVPHVGWNVVSFKKENPLLKGMPPQQRFYFTHSYYVDCACENDVLATTQYGHPFASMVHRKNIFGTQFHPEKSHSHGIELIKNFVRLMSC